MALMYRWRDPKERWPVAFFLSLYPHDAKTTSPYEPKGLKRCPHCHGSGFVSASGYTPHHPRNPSE